MTALSVSALTSALSLLLAASALPAQTTSTAPAQPGVSKVRIVRLSEVKGEVQVDVARGQGYEAAMPNLPVVENTRLRTGDGVAEVEFEDNSTLRLTPNSEVDFPQLERTATGGTLSTVHIISGTVYASLLKTPQDQFTLRFGRDTVNLPPNSHVRVNVGDLEATLAVLDGSAQVNGAFGSVDIPRKKTATFIWTDNGAPTVRKDIPEEAFDSWDKTSAGYHEHVASASAFGNSPYSYGLNDMNYYGSFMNAGGCGTMWRPYFASAAWDPYANGAWAWYQGAGYSWVSPYPWGWTPYHSGSWAFCPGTGWGWQPGGNWYGLNNTAFAATSGSSRVASILPHPPIGAPRLGHPVITPVNVRPLPVSTIQAGSEFVFRRDSAGMGVPRDGLGHLDKFSRSTVSHGLASTPVYMTGLVARPGATFNGRSGQMNSIRQTNSLVTAGSIHRGYAPAPMPSMSAERGISGPSGGGFHGNSGMSSPPPAMSAPAPSIGAHGGGGGGVAPRGH